ncbi:MAG: cell division protein FtsZ [Bacteroidota bacterium]|jgi:cell division protein FtsZ
MIHFDLPKQKSSIIKVLGVGGGGSNAVNFMFDQNIEGVDFIICNTDAKAIEQSRIPNKIQLGPHLTQGLGAGANPEVGKLATEESLEEIKRILEVNTKMAFITVGMGGGTGTGGAPIIAQICKDLGILTVGIVTTPFGFEGPRRLQQAQEGIDKLKPHVDTLLVISNDKLRMQYGNLKMKEAFGKADNVLATAAKCITDIINSRGHIIVDFADVCTVMKNGGVAILGKAEVEGENRAQLAIEEAIASPLLNDSDIKGAKWILININSAEGDYECTMDELEIINNHLRMQAGEDTDVIVGMGYDNTLDKKIGITLVATGFEHKDPFAKGPVHTKAVPQEEKIVMTLQTEQPAPMPAITFVEPEPVVEEVAPVVEAATPIVEAVAPVATVAEIPSMQSLVQQSLPLEQNDPLMVRPTFTPLVVEEEAYVAQVEEAYVAPVEEERYVLQFELSPEITEEVVLPEVETEIVTPPVTASEALLQFTVNATPTAPATNSFTGTILNKPTNIYADESVAATPVVHVQETAPVQEVTSVKETAVSEMPIQEVVVPVAPIAVGIASSVSYIAPNPMAAQPAPAAPAQQSYRTSFGESLNELEEDAELGLCDMELIEKPEMPSYSQATNMAAPASFIDDSMFDDAEEQKRRAAERIQKLRNLSFNMSGGGAESGSEFDNVPAYVRRNMELFGSTLTTVEDFYSKYTVGKDDKDQTQISTLNTFLHGKKPD